jgi:hypothetical protein
MITIRDGIIHNDDEKIGKVRATGAIQMFPGKGGLRPAVDAWIAENSPVTPASPATPASRPPCPPHTGIGMKSPGVAEWHADHATREELEALDEQERSVLRYCLGLCRPGEPFPI